GAFGKMGQEVCKMVEAEQQFKLEAIIDPSQRSWNDVPIFTSLEEAFTTASIDVLIDFTTPSTVMKNTRMAIEYGVRPVVGTTGLRQDEIEILDELCQARKLGGIIAPNFAIGAVLMMRFAQIAAKYMPHVEIIEFH